MRVHITVLKLAQTQMECTDDKKQLPTSKFTRRLVGV